ncbi:choline dehydrogenase [Trichoderma barbatum]
MASNLARGGYSVLLLEAGDDSTYEGADIPIVGSGYPLGPTWDFFCQHYPEGDSRNLEFNHLTWMTPEGRYWVGKTDPPEGSELLGIYYPRGATLGGSSMINGLNRFCSIFQKIEHNNYLKHETCGHGFKGYFRTTMPNRVDNPQPVTNPYMKALAEDIGETEPLIDLYEEIPTRLTPAVIHKKQCTVSPCIHTSTAPGTAHAIYPGVGQNLMDNEELLIVAQGAAYINASLVLGYPLLKTNASVDRDNDIWLLQAGVPFPGFWPSNQTNENLPKDPPGTWGVGLVKGNPQNTAGYVRLRSKDPRDRPEINFNLFASDRDKVDHRAMRETMIRIRRIFVRSGADIVEPACPSGLAADGSCSDPGVDETWLEGQTFGHHPTCTWRMGPDGDPNAVLDNKLRVRGVDGLRVVDASSFASVPGWFPALPTFMIAQKVADEMQKKLTD